MIPFECPHCGLSTAVDDQYAGMTGPCAGCGRTITVPSVAPVTPGPDATRQAGMPRWMKWGIGLSIACLVVLSIGSISVWLLKPVVTKARATAQKKRCASDQAGRPRTKMPVRMLCLPGQNH